MNMTMRILGGAVVSAGGLNLWVRFKDQVEGDDPFSEHSRTQHNKHWVSGMHEPYVPHSAQRAFIQKYFSQFQHLIPSSSEDFSKQNSLKSPVHIRHLAECPKMDPSNIESGNTIVVGGPPAIMPMAFEKGITYINDRRRPPIAFGSAFHLEWDAVSEAPTSSQPLHFMVDQIKRVVIPELLASTEKTGHFSWKSLDWVSWIQNPSKWSVGARIAIAFQRFTQSGPHPAVIEEVAARSKNNERFYQLLNKKLQDRLMMPGEGSIYIARTPEEKESLVNMQKNLKEEKRAFSVLSKEQTIKEFGYLPEGMAFGKKMHDRALSPNFLELLSNQILKNGGRVIDARVTTIYTDDPDQGGVVEYRTNSDDKIHYIHFQKVIMSLGTQQVFGIDNAPLFDIVSARGVSSIAMAILPKEAKLPSVFVCGDTNHVTKLAGPVPFQGHNLFLLRMTCGACITPKSDSANYDGNAAVGLKKAVNTVLGGRIEMLTVYGCNRQVSQYGQIHWIQVPKTLKTASNGFIPRGDTEDIGSSLPNKTTGIFIQYGAGGGGLTQAPSK